MPLMLVEGPAAEPVPPSDLKARLHVGGDDEDTLLASLIVAARLHVEESFGLALISQRWSLFLDRWPRRAALTLPRWPLQKVEAIRIHQADGSIGILEPSAYLADAWSRPGRVMLNKGASRPAPGRAANGIEIVFAAGFGAWPADVPEPLRLAVLLLAAAWYEDRAPATIESQLVVPVAVRGLLAPYAERRL